MSIKRIFKGYFIWIANNALLLTGIIGIEGAITVPDIKHIIATSIIVLLWFATGHIIVASFLVDKIEHIKLEPTGIAKEIPWKENDNNTAEE